MHEQTPALILQMTRDLALYGAHDHCEASREVNVRDILYNEQYGKPSSTFLADAGVGKGGGGGCFDKAR